MSGVPPDRLRFTPLFVVMFFSTWGMSVMAPALNLYAEHFGVSFAGIGVAVAAFPLGRLASDVGAGVLADRWTKSSTCIVGCLVLASASLVAAGTSSFAVLVGARVVQGIGSALVATAATALVIAHAEPGRLGERLALTQGAFMLGTTVGPVTGGYLIERSGLSAPFVVYAGLCAAGAVISVFGIRRLDDVQGRVGSQTHVPSFVAIRELLRSPALRIALVLGVGLFVVRGGARSTAVPLFAEVELGMSSSGVGWVLTIAALANLAVVRDSGRALDRFGRRRVIIGSMWATTLALAGFLFVGDPVALTIVTSVLAITSTFASIGPAAVAGDVASDATRSTAVGMQRMSLDLGQVLGPIIAGTLTGLVGFRTTFLAFGAVVGVLAVFAHRMPETGRRLGAS